MVLVGLVWPNGPGAVHYGLAGLLVLAMMWSWWRGWQDDGERFVRAVHWTIIASTLVTFQTGTTNQVLLLIPMFAWLSSALERWGRRRVLIGAVILQMMLWALFLTTISGNWENPVLFLPLPLFSLAVMVGIEVCCWRTTSRQVGSPGLGDAR